MLYAGLVKINIRLYKATAASLLISSFAGPIVCDDTNWGATKDVAQLAYCLFINSGYATLLPLIILFFVVSIVFKAFKGDSSIVAPWLCFSLIICIHSLARVLIIPNDAFPTHNTDDSQAGAIYNALQADLVRGCNCPAIFKARQQLACSKVVASQ